MEKKLIRTFSTFGPWLAPLANAYVVYRATINQLGYPWPVALLIAAFFEVIGVVSVVTVIEFWQYNQTKRLSDKAMPVTIAGAATASYLLATITFTVLLDVFPELARVAPAFFPLLTIVAGLNIGLRFVYDKEIGRQHEEADKRAAARLASKAPKPPRKAAAPVSVAPVASRPVSTNGHGPGQNGRIRDDQINEQVGDYVGVSDWRLLPEEYRAAVQDIPPKVLVKRHGIGQSTARRWRQTSREMNHVS
jgi:hypothetical protein